jgi:rfaE bifunctional protein kinase chain/domain
MTSLNRTRARALMAQFPRRRVLVVGDLMLDRYIEGAVDRISPEAPVPVVRVQDTRAMPGGASNVAMNLRALGARADVCGALGLDAAGAEVEAALAAAGVRFRGARCPGWPTIVKTRIMAGRQQLVRVDEEQPLTVGRAETAALAACAARAAAGADAVVLEDYNKGLLVQPVVTAVARAARAAGIPLGLDPKDNETLRVPGLWFATPNRREAFLNAGLRDPGAGEAPLRDRPLLRAAAALMARWRPRHLAVTLGPQGMLLLSADGRPRHVPTRARAVFDVSGAGDTVIAVMALGLAAGATFEEAAELANYAAGVVVAKVGAATCAPEELLAHMEACGAP